METQLHLEQLEWPEEDGQPVEIQFVKDKEFSGNRIVVDNHHFQRCKFENCHFVHSGGHYAFEHCRITGTCMFSPTGGARKAIRLYEALQPALRKNRPPL
jgi:hypothetical protein